MSHAPSLLYPSHLSTTSLSTCTLISDLQLDRQPDLYCRDLHTGIFLAPIHRMCLSVLWLKRHRLQSGALKDGDKKGGEPEGWEHQISRFFFFSHPRNYYFPYLGVSSWNIGGVFEGQSPRQCTFGVLWIILCELQRPGLVGPPGFHKKTQRAKCALFRLQLSKTPPKFHQRTLREGENEQLGGRKKKSEFLGGRRRAVQRTAVL